MYTFVFIYIIKFISVCVQYDMYVYALCIQSTIIRLYLYGNENIHLWVQYVAYNMCVCICICTVCLHLCSSYGFTCVLLFMYGVYFM